MRKKLTVIDTTLRDGEQSAGVAFSHKEKLNIAKHLDQLGVDIIEAGIPAMSKHEQMTVSDIMDLGLNAEILTWNRMKIADIQAAMATGGSHIHISVPVSDLHITKKLGLTRDKLLYEYEKVLDYCYGHDLNVSIGGEDASRADEKFLATVYGKGIEYGVRRIRYADTISALTPFTAFEKTRELIDNIAGYLGVERNELMSDLLIDFHGHNDLGMGTANALGAYKAGARGISCSVNGLGERAGNTPLEEIVLALELLEDVSCNIKAKEIMRVSKLVENYSGRTLQESKPIVGGLVFSHEAGIHVDGLLKDRKIYTFVDPKPLGRRHSFVKGKHSGKSIEKVMY